MVFRELEARELIDLNVTLAVNLPFNRNIAYVLINLPIAYDDLWFH